MLLTEYNESKTMEMFKEEGVKIGHNKALVETAQRMLDQQKYSMEEIATVCNLSIENVRQLAKKKTN